MADLSTQQVKLANLTNVTEVITVNLKPAGSDDGIFMKTLEQNSFIIEKICQIDRGILEEISRLVPAPLLYENIS